MTKKQLVIQHDLSRLNPQELNQYLRDVSEFIGLDPDLNGLDTIWMDNETGPGKSLVVYARRGTAEILRNKQGIEVSSLTDKIINGSVVFTAIGKDKNNRQEIATGSKYLGNLSGKALDDAIMTASTRALRRLTMQFTSLGILDESEVKASIADTINPASGAQLAGSPVVMPPAPSVPPNNAPGKDVTVTNVPALPAPPVLINQEENLRQVYAEGAAALANMKTAEQFKAEAAIQENIIQAAIHADILTTAFPVNTVESAVTTDTQPDIQAAKPKRARKSRNTVSMDGPEPEVVSTPAPVVEVAPQPAPVPATPIMEQVTNPVVAPETVAAITPPVPPTGTSVPNQGTDFEGKPTPEQMADFRRRISVYTAELPSSENMGSVQKMRAFLTRMNGGTAPQFMTVDQFEETLAWFESFVAKNATKGLIKYINDSLGVR